MQQLGWQREERGWAWKLRLLFLSNQVADSTAQKPGGGNVAGRMADAWNLILRLWIRLTPYKTPPSAFQTFSRRSYSEATSFKSRWGLLSHMVAVF